MLELAYIPPHSQVADLSNKGQVWRVEFQASNDQYFLPSSGKLEEHMFFMLLFL